MNKKEKLKKEVKNLEQQRWSKKIKLMNICQHDNVSIDSVTYGSESNEYEVTCLDCGKYFTVVGSKYSNLNDKPNVRPV